MATVTEAESCLAKVNICGAQLGHCFWIGKREIARKEFEDDAKKATVDI